MAHGGTSWRRRHRRTGKPEAMGYPVPEVMLGVELQVAHHMQQGQDGQGIAGARVGLQRGVRMRKGRGQFERPMSVGGTNCQAGQHRLEKKLQADERRKGVAGGPAPAT